MKIKTEDILEAKEVEEESSEESDEEMGSQNLKDIAEKK